MASIVPPAMTAAAAPVRDQRLIVNLAQSQVGGTACSPGYVFSGYRSCSSSYSGEWCSIFAAWVWSNADSYIETGWTGEGLSADSRHFEHYGTHFGTLHKVPATPSPGDAAVFWDGSNIQHVGIVTSVSGGLVYTVEGNVADKNGNNYQVRNTGRYYVSNGTPYNNPLGWTIKEYISPAVSGQSCMPGQPC
jgi:hypothetical protein